MSSYSRLDDRCVDDPIIRAYLHNEVVAKSTSRDTDLQDYDVRPEEEYRPDLVAMRVWGTSELRWAVRIIADVETEFDPLPVGTTLQAPSMAWIRDRIRHYTSSGEFTGTVGVD